VGQRRAHIARAVGPNVIRSGRQNSKERMESPSRALLTSSSVGARQSPYNIGYCRYAFRSTDERKGLAAVTRRRAYGRPMRCAEQSTEKVECCDTVLERNDRF
jgi:hypothetical protein